ncbi:binary toxin-like calcium binding domain-containing protein, partial [Bacillus solimangrovi]|uniref:binary toxin-like calcium binding domain-containing protein n=1 Tax=Bacillus solimangrovi TaxID=1305675 RepID=UPI000AC1A208
MCKTRNKKRLVSILTTFALTTQMFPLSSSTSYARVIEDDPNETFSQEINNTSIITNGLQGTYYSDAQFTEHLLIRMEDSDAMYDLDALKIPKVFKGKMENVHSIKWDGTIEPQYSEVYTFTTSDNEHIKLWVNDQILINGLNFDPLPIQMEEGELYHIRVAYSNPDEPLTDLDIKWSSESQEEEVISKEHIFLPVHSEDAGNSFSPEDLLVDELEEVIEEMSEELLEIQEEVIESTEEQVEETETPEPTEEQIEETETSEPLEEQVEEVETAETIKEQVEEAEITEPTEEQTEEAEITELIDEQVEAGGTESTDEQIETETLAKKVSEVGLFGSTAALDNLVGQNDEPSSVDTDNDGIIDYWEMEGYTHIAGLGLVSWEDEYAEFDAQRYVTSPYRKSTDEDPYSDLEEVMGQVDQAIDPLATHPLVPAFPDIQAEIESITITPNEMITTTDGTVLTEAWSDSTDKSKTTASSLGFKSGFEVGFEKSFGIKEGGASAKINGKVYGEANGQWDKSKTKTTTRVDSKQDTTSWSQATTTNPSEAATSVWNVKYTNKGTAPAYEIVPSLSLQIGDKTAVSMVPASTNIIQSIAPDNYYPSNGTIALQYIESGTVDTLPIKLTLDQVQLIQMGYPISLTTNQINAKALQLDNNGDPYLDDWNKYKVAIDAVSASITYVHPDKGEK